MIKYNYINGACQMLHDGGGIYTYNGYNYSDAGVAGSVIDHNIILNVYGNTDGRPSEGSGPYYGFGIYMDNATHDVLIENNTIAGASCGFITNSGGRLTLNNNTNFI